MTKNVSLVVMMLGFFSTLSLAMKVVPSLISKITLEKAYAKGALGDGPFKQVVEQNVVKAMSNKIDHDIGITVFNQSKDWEPLTGNSSGTHLLRFSISTNKFVTGKFKISGAKTASFYLNQSLIAGDKDYSVTLLNQDYRALLVVSGVEQWQALSIEWLDDGVKETNKIEPGMAQQSSVVFGNDHSYKRASMKQYYDSETVSSLSIPPDGELLI